MTTNADIEAMDLAALDVAWIVENDKIQAAYWAFTRQARAKPPFMVVPEAYRRRALIEVRQLKIRRASAICQGHEK